MIKKINQAASILGLVLCAVLAYVFWKAGLFDSKEALTSCISRFGWAGPAVFITFQAASTERTPKIMVTPLFKKFSGAYAIISTAER